LKFDCSILLGFPLIEPELLYSGSHNPHGTCCFGWRFFRDWTTHTERVLPLSNEACCLQEGCLKLIDISSFCIFTSLLFFPTLWHTKLNLSRASLCLGLWLVTLLLLSLHGLFLFLFLLLFQFILFIMISLLLNDKLQVTTACHTLPRRKGCYIDFLISRLFFVLRLIDCNRLPRLSTHRLHLKFGLLSVTQFQSQFVSWFS